MKMPKEDYFSGGAVQQVLKTPASVTADSNAAGVDIRDYKGECMVVANILNTAGTAPTMDVKIQAAEDADVIDTVGYTGTGDGTCTEIEGGPDAVAEDITVTFTSATSADVVGSVTGAIGTATVGTKFTSPQINFLLTAGATAFGLSDVFTIGVLARTYTNKVTFTQVAAAASIQKKTINVDEIGRFIRANFDIGGTGPAYTIGIALYGMK